MAALRDDYPEEAFSPDGVLWWEQEFHTGTRQVFGGEQKLAAWLYWNVDEGSTFTMPVLRDALDSSAEHLNRRLRSLRELGWVLPSYQDDRTLSTGQYRVEVKGWWPGEGARPRTGGAVSQRIRRIVFDRDGSRCVICGVGSGEQYPGEPTSRATMTIGHRIAQALGGSDRPDNLRTECSRCNEPRREEGRRPERFDEIFTEIRRFSREDLRTLHQWVVDGQRGRSKVDEIYDRLRSLGHEEQRDAASRIQEMLLGRA